MTIDDGRTVAATASGSSSHGPSCAGCCSTATTPGRLAAAAEVGIRRLRDDRAVLDALDPAARRTRRRRRRRPASRCSRRAARCTASTSPGAAGPELNIAAQHARTHHGDLVDRADRRRPAPLDAGGALGRAARAAARGAGRASRLRRRGDRPEPGGARPRALPAGTAIAAARRRARRIVRRGPRRRADRGRLDRVDRSSATRPRWSPTLPISHDVFDELVEPVDIVAADRTRTRSSDATG